ncbi:MAG: GNAT family N-acetyltransferase [Proteobacteria bacterium]|nr:MAG: GNAT family N-acetyltransferase [Pseudomonadota bacterium]
MNVDAVIEALRHDHRACAWPGETVDARPHVTRHGILNGEVNFVTAHALSPESADAVIAEELAHYAARGKSFEWKLFSFDEPKDLRQRLESAGFEIGAPEAVMIYDLRDGLEPFSDPICDVRRIDKEENLRDFRLGSEEAFGKDFAPTTDALAEAIRSGDEGNTAFVAYLDGQPASVGRLYTSPISLFAGLYGGGTRPPFRGRGTYRAVVAARALAAHRSGARYLMVDAKPTSEPILERLGFTRVATTWPCDSPEATL